MSDHKVVSRPEIRLATASDRDEIRSVGIDPQASDMVVIETLNDQMTGALAIADQPFESEILGVLTKQIIRIWQGESSRSNSNAFFDRAIDLAANQGIQLIMYRAPEDETQTVERLEGAGFKTFEALQTFECALGKTMSDELPTGVEFAQRTDADECAEIAASIFQTDRFHADPEIPNSRSIALYQSLGFKLVQSAQTLHLHCAR
jgi:hypothetical protein